VSESSGRQVRPDVAVDHRAAANSSSTLYFRSAGGAHVTEHVTEQLDVNCGHLALLRSTGIQIDVYKSSLFLLRQSTASELEMKL